MDLSERFSSYRELFERYEYLNCRFRDLDYFIHEFSNRSKVFCDQNVTVSWLDDDPLTFPVPYDVLIPVLISYRDKISSELDDLHEFLSNLPDYDK